MCEKGTASAKKLTSVDWRTSESIEGMKKFEKRLHKYEEKKAKCQRKFELEKQRFITMTENYAQAVKDDNNHLK